jgi:ABC transporter
LRSAKISLLGGAAGGFASAVVWAALGLLVATGHISVAALGAAFLALTRVSSSLDGIIAYGAQLFRTGMYLDDWADFIDEAGGHRTNRGTEIPTGPTVVRAQNVTFRYPNADRPALDGVSLEVRRGEVLALVGENGSGKTTLSKLLSALCLPDQGLIAWDGVDTRSLDAEAAWSRIAVVRRTLLAGLCRRERTSPWASPRPRETTPSSMLLGRQAPTRSSMISAAACTRCSPGNGGAGRNCRAGSGSASGRHGRAGCASGMVLMLSTVSGPLEAPGPAPQHARRVQA